MSIVDISDIEISPDLEKIRANRAKLMAKRGVVNAALKLLSAMETANQDMCTHPGRTSYSDPRDWGNNPCPVCASTR